jgi:pyruvate-ferredoxin/flavodoxin oxidoreductase
MAMSYGHVYVARVAMGYNSGQTVRAMVEAESYNGPSVIIAYSHCIEHGINMAKGLEQQKAAVNAGLWPLFRYDPRRAQEGKNPLQLDSKEPSMSIEEYMYKEIRFRALKQSKPEIAEDLLHKAQERVNDQWQLYKYLAERPYDGQNGSGDSAEGAGKASQKAGAPGE